MIKHLSTLSELVFPVVTAEKPKNLKEDNTNIYFDDNILLKRDTLEDTINIKQVWIPKTYTYIIAPEALLSNYDLLTRRIIIDSTLNIFIPIKKLKLITKTSNFSHKQGNFVKVDDCSYYLHMVHDKSGKYPILAIVDDVYFLTGWQNEKIKQYETYI